MRVVAVSMVKNEADVIEAFCRHTAAFADRHLVFDHQSSDGTSFLLTRLAREGLPITAYTDDRVEYLQAERTTELMRRAVRDFGADWVIPLDADEFPQPGRAQDFRRMLEGLPTDRPTRLWLKDYAPHPADDPAEPNPVLRLRHRFPHLSAGKVLVPRPLAAHPACTLGPGNHELRRDGRPVEPLRLDEIWLAHFPARTAAQVVAKVVLNELQRLAGGTNSGGGTHLRRHFLRLLAAPHMYFHAPESYIRGEQPEQATYWGEPLRFPPPVGDWERATIGLLAYAEKLATSHGMLKDAASQPSPATQSLWRMAWQRLIRRPAPPASPPMQFREGLTLPDSRSGMPAGCDIELIRAAADADAVRLTVRIRNTGLYIWRAGAAGEPGAVNLGVRLHVNGRLKNPDFSRVTLPADLEPGDEVTLTPVIPRPAEPNASFRLDMLAEEITWFDYPGQEIVLDALPPARAAA